MARKDNIYYKRIAIEYDEKSTHASAKKMKDTINQAVAEATEKVDAIFDAIKSGDDVDLKGLTDAMKKISESTNNTSNNYEMLEAQITGLTNSLKEFDKDFEKINNRIDGLSDRTRVALTNIRGLVSGLQNTIASPERMRRNFVADLEFMAKAAKSYKDELKENPSIDISGLKKQIFAMADELHNMGDLGPIANKTTISHFMALADLVRDMGDEATDLRIEMAKIGESLVKSAGSKGLGFKTDRGYQSDLEFKQLKERERALEQHQKRVDQITAVMDGQTDMTLDADKESQSLPQKIRAYEKYISQLKALENQGKQESAEYAEILSNIMAYANSIDTEMAKLGDKANKNQKERYQQVLTSLKVDDQPDAANLYSFWSNMAASNEVAFKQYLEELENQTDVLSNAILTSQEALAKLEMKPVKKQPKKGKDENKSSQTDLPADKQVEVPVKVVPSIKIGEWKTIIKQKLKQIEDAQDAPKLKIGLNLQKLTQSNTELQNIRDIKLFDGDKSKDVKAFEEHLNSLKDTLTKKRQELDERTKQWRQSIGKALELEFKFKGLGQRALDDLASDIDEVIQDVNDKIADNPIILQTNIEELVQTIQDKLNNLKIDKITVSDITPSGNLNLSQVVPTVGTRVVAPTAPMSTADAQKLAEIISQGVTGVQKGTGTTVPKTPAATADKKEKEAEQKILAQVVADLYSNLTHKVNKDGKVTGQQQYIQEHFPALHQALQNLVANPSGNTLTSVLTADDFVHFAQDWGNPKDLIPIIAQAIAKERAEIDDGNIRAQNDADIKAINKASSSLAKKGKLDLDTEKTPNLAKAISTLMQFGNTDKTLEQKMQAIAHFVTSVDAAQLELSKAKFPQVFEDIQWLMKSLVEFSNSTDERSKMRVDKNQRPVLDDDGKLIYDQFKLTDLIKEAFPQVFKVLSSLDVNNITIDDIKALSSTPDFGKFISTYGDSIYTMSEGKTTPVIDIVFDNPDMIRAVYDAVFKALDLSDEISTLLTGASKNKFDFTQQLLSLKAGRGDLEDYSKEGVASRYAAGAKAKTIMKWMLDYAEILQHIAKLHNTRTNPNRLSDESLGAQAEWVSKREVSKDDLNEMIKYSGTSNAASIQWMEEKLDTAKQRLDEVENSIRVRQQNLEKLKHSMKDTDVYKKEEIKLAKDIQVRDSWAEKYNQMAATLEAAREPERQAILKLLGMTEANIVDSTDKDLASVLTPVLGAIAEYKRKSSIANELKEKLSPSLKEALDQEGDYKTNLADVVSKEIAKAVSGKSAQGKAITAVLKANGVDIQALSGLSNTDLTATDQWQIISDNILNNPKVNFANLIQDLTTGSEQLKRGYPQFINLLKYAESYAEAAWSVDPGKLSAMGVIDENVKNIRWGARETTDKKYFTKVDVAKSNVIAQRLSHAEELLESYENELSYKRESAPPPEAKLKLNTSAQQELLEETAKIKGLNKEYRKQIRDAIEQLENGKSIEQQLADAKKDYENTLRGVDKQAELLLQAPMSDEDRSIVQSFVNGEMLSAEQRDKFDKLISPAKEKYKIAVSARDAAKSRYDSLTRMDKLIQENGPAAWYQQQNQEIKMLEQHIEHLKADIKQLETELDVALTEEAADPEKKSQYTVGKWGTRTRRKHGLDDLFMQYGFVVTDEKGKSLKVGNWSGGEDADADVNFEGFFYRAIAKEFPKWIKAETLLTAGFSPATAKALNMPAYQSRAVEPPLQYRKQYIDNRISGLENAIKKQEADLSDLKANQDSNLVEEIGKILSTYAHTYDGEQKDLEATAEYSFDVMRKRDQADSLRGELRLAAIRQENAEMELATVTQTHNILLEGQQSRQANVSQYLPDYEALEAMGKEQVQSILLNIWQDARAYSGEMAVERSRKIQQYDQTISVLKSELNDVDTERASLIADKAKREADAAELKNKYGTEDSYYKRELKYIDDIVKRIAALPEKENALKAQIDETESEKNAYVQQSSTQGKSFNRDMLILQDAIRNGLDENAYQSVQAIQQAMDNQFNQQVEKARIAVVNADTELEHARTAVSELTEKINVAEQAYQTTKQQTVQKLAKKNNSDVIELTDAEKNVVEIFDRLRKAKDQYKAILDTPKSDDEEANAKRNEQIATLDQTIQELTNALSEAVKPLLGSDRAMKAREHLEQQIANVTAKLEADKSELQTLNSGITGKSKLMQDMDSLSSMLMLAKGYQAFYVKKENELTNRLNTQTATYDEAKVSGEASPEYLEHLNNLMRTTREELDAVSKEAAWAKEQARAISKLMNARRKELNAQYESVVEGTAPTATEPTTDTTATTPTTEAVIEAEIGSTDIKNWLTSILTGANVVDGATTLIGLPEDIAKDSTLKQILAALTGPYNSEIAAIEEQLKAEYAKLAALDGNDNPPTPPTTPPPSGGNNGGGDKPTPAKQQPKTKGSAKAEKIEDALITAKAQTVSALEQRLKKDKSLSEQQQQAIQNAIDIIKQQNVVDEKILAAEKSRLEADNTLMSIGKKGVSGKVKGSYVKEALGETLTDKDKENLGKLKDTNKIAAAKAYGEAGANVARAITSYVDSVVGTVATEVASTEPKKDTKGKTIKKADTKQNAQTDKDTKEQKDAVAKVEAKVKSLKEQYPKATKANLAVIEQLMDAKENDETLKDHERDKLESVIRYLNGRNTIDDKFAKLQEVEEVEQKQLYEAFKGKEDRRMAKKVAIALAQNKTLKAEEQEWYGKFRRGSDKSKAINAYKNEVSKKLGGNPEYQRNAFELAQKILGQAKDDSVDEQHLKALEAEHAQLVAEQRELTQAAKQVVELAMQKLADPNLSQEERDKITGALQAAQIQQSTTDTTLIKETVGQTDKDLFATIVKSNEETQALLRIFREHSFAIKDGVVTDVQVGTYGRTPKVKDNTADTIGHIHPDNTMFSTDDIKSTANMIKDNKSLNTHILMTQKGKIVWNNLQATTSQQLDELYNNLKAIASWLSKFNHSIPNIEDYYSTIAAQMFSDAGLDVGYYTRNKKGGYTNVSRTVGGVSAETIQAIIGEAKNNSNNKDILNQVKPNNFFRFDNPFANVVDEINNIQRAITQGTPLVQYLEKFGTLVDALDDFSSVNPDAEALKHKLQQLMLDIEQEPKADWSKDQRVLELFGGYDDFNKKQNGDILKTFTPVVDSQDVKDALTGGDGKVEVEVEVVPEVKPEDITEAVNVAEAQADTTVTTDPEIPAGEVAQEITEAEQRGETVADVTPEVPTTPVANVPEAVDERTQILNNIARLEQQLDDEKAKGGYLATAANQQTIIEILKGGLKVDGTTVKGEGEDSGATKKKQDDTPKVKYTAQTDNVNKRKAGIEARVKALYGDNAIEQQSDSMGEAWQKYNQLHEAFINNEKTYLAEGKTLTEQQKEQLISEQAELKVAEDQLRKQISRAEKLKLTEIDRQQRNSNLDIEEQMKLFAGINDTAEYQWKFNKETQTASYVIQGANNSIREMTIAYDGLSQSLVKGEKKQIATFSNMDKFIQGIKAKWVEVARYMASFASLYRVFGEIRRGVQYVREINAALTELKKVTDATDATYDKFLQDMSKTAGVIGSTTSELTTMAAEWSRLGYSIQDAGKLAESTAILLNVSEFTDATQASQALISTMQAFQYTADQSQHVVDILNEVGNNYAVSSDGIATALQDSASALMAAGNNLEQSVALVAAANKVVQDPNSVGK